MFYCNPKKIVWDEELKKTSLGTLYPYKSKTRENSWVARVYHAKNNEDAIRHLNKTLLNFSCDHPSLVSIGGYFFEKIRVGWNICTKLLKMEATLRDIIDSHAMVQSRIPEKDIIACLCSLISALEYLHNKGIAHRNINPQNIFSDKDGQIRLGEIGTRLEAEDDDATFYMTSSEQEARLYLPPEFINKLPPYSKSFLFKTDSWSLGCVIKEMCSVGVSFSQEETKDIRKTLKKLEEHHSKELMSVLKSLLEIDEYKRGSIQDMKKIVQEYFGITSASLSRETRQFGKTLEKQLENKNRNNDFEQSIDFSKLTHEKKLAQDKRAQDQAFFEKRLKIIKKEVDEKWQDYLIFDPEKSFALEPVFATKVTDSVIKEFMTELRQLLEKKDLGCLNNFEFSLAQCKQITDQGLEDFSHSFHNFFNSLKVVSLNFSSCEKISDKGLKALSHQIETSIKGLKSLNLDLTNCDKITSEGMKSLSKSISNNSKTLEQLSLKFDGCKKITEEGVKAITANVNYRFEELQELNINFSSCTDLKDEGILGLIKNIQYTPPAKRIDPKKSLFPTIQESNSHIQNEMKLENLHISFGFTKITDAGLQGLISCINSDFPSLKKLELDLEVCFGLTDKGIKTLASSLQSGFKKLETLILNFAWCIRISDQGFQELVKKIKTSLPNIKALQMSFYQCDDVSEEEKEAARQLLDHIPQLLIC